MSTKGQEITPQIDPMIDWLQKLVETQDRGTLAELRRGLTLEREQLHVLYSVIPSGYLEYRGWRGKYERDETERRFMLASLFALHPVSFTRSELGARRRNIGDSLRLLALRRHEWRGAGDVPDDSLLPDPLKRRMDALLASRNEDLFEHLRHVIRLLKSEEVPVDWDQLLRDLRRWDDVDRNVQWRWSRSFYVGYSERQKGGEANVS